MTNFNGMDHRVDGASLFKIKNSRKTEDLGKR